MIQGVEHFALCADNLPILIAWYQHIFDLELIKEGEDGPLFLRFPDGFLIEFLPMTDATAAPPIEKEQGFRHLAIAVSPIEEMVDTLKQEGVEIVDDFKIVPNGTKLFLFRDIEGNIVQLVERAAPLGS